jgi:uncharacterized protein YwgA
MVHTETIPVETGTDLVLALLYAGGDRKTENEEIIGNTRMDKLMFLLEKETTLRKYIRDFKFDAYNFGPYSSELFDSVQALVNAGLVKAETGTVEKKSESEEYLDEADRYQIEIQMEDNIETQKNPTTYSLTPQGGIVASALWHSLSQSEQTELTTIKKRFNSINLRELLRYIYRKYPESANKSLIRDQVF